MTQARAWRQSDRRAQFDAALRVARSYSQRHAAGKYVALKTSRLRKSVSQVVLMYVFLTSCSVRCTLPAHMFPCTKRQPRQALCLFSGLAGHAVFQSPFGQSN
jgi:hypothetical protein